MYKEIQKAITDLLEEKIKLIKGLIKNPEKKEE